MDLESALLVVVAGASLYLLAGIRIVRDSERVAVTRRGEFRELRGPGLIIAAGLPGIGYHRVRYRAAGVIRSADRLALDGLELPYESLAPLATGTRVRVVGFGPYRVHVEPAPRAR